MCSITKNISGVLYFEDFTEGQQFASGEYALTKEASIAFAHQFDPQYFHTDEDAAKRGIWGRLVASGWHTAAISMRLKLDTPLGRVSGGLIGMGIDSVKWPRPVYPGDRLRIAVTILGKRQSKSRPSHGILHYRIETLNQQDEVVMELTTAVLVPKRQE